MQALRTSSMLARLILAWFMLTVGAAIASPIVHPQAMELVCSTGGGGAKLVAVALPPRTRLPHRPAITRWTVPLCLHFSAPPPQAQPVPMVHPQPLAHALRPAVAATLAALAGAPLPPRGPPAVVFPELKPAPPAGAAHIAACPFAPSR